MMARNKKDYMKKLLIIVMAFSLAFSGCRKEAEQIVSRPLNEVKDSVVVASPTPTPTPIPSPSPSGSPSPTEVNKVLWDLVGGAGELLYMWAVAFAIAGGAAVLILAYHVYIAPRFQQFDDEAAA
jgi:hypothetical protein